MFGTHTLSRTSFGTNNRRSIISFAEWHHIQSVEKNCEEEGCDNILPPKTQFMSSNDKKFSTVTNSALQISLTIINYPATAAISELA